MLPNKKSQLFQIVNKTICMWSSSFLKTWTFTLAPCTYGVTIMLGTCGVQPERTYFKPIYHVNISSTKDYKSDGLKWHNCERERCARFAWSQLNIPFLLKISTTSYMKFPWNKSIQNSQKFATCKANATHTHTMLQLNYNQELINIGTL